LIEVLVSQVNNLLLVAMVVSQLIFLICPDVTIKIKKMGTWFHLYSDALFGLAYHKTSQKEVEQTWFRNVFLSAR